MIMASAATAAPASRANRIAHSAYFALTVAIPFLLIHAFLQARTSEIVDGLEAAKISFLNVTQRLKAESGATTR